MSSRNRVFFGKIPPDTRRRELEDWLNDNGFRHVENVQLKTGYAFVDFRSQIDADDCVKELDSRDFLGSRITVELARGPKSRDEYQTRDYRHTDNYNSRRDRTNGYYRDRYGAPYNTEWRLIVENLSTRIGWQEMKDFFRQVGNVTYSECHRSKPGEGAVEFSCRDDLRRAMDRLDGQEFMGRRIRLIDASPSGLSRRETGRYGDRSRSVSRGRYARRRRTRSYSHHSKHRSRSPRI